MPHSQYAWNTRMVSSSPEGQCYPAALVHFTYELLGIFSVATKAFIFAESIFDTAHLEMVPAIFFE